MAYPNFSSNKIISSSAASNSVRKVSIRLHFSCINLIDAVEQEFHMQFQMKEVSGMKNVGEMADIVANRATEKPKKRGLFRR